MSALASATTESGGASSGANSMTTNTEAIIAAATNAEAAAAVAQEQGATLVTVHPAVIEAPLNATEGQANEGEENEGDGKDKQFFCFSVMHSLYYCSSVIHDFSTSLCAYVDYSLVVKKTAHLYC